ncbi:MAG: hypothetical protein QW203_03420 [Thermoplasmatales archaeon]
MTPSCFSSNKKDKSEQDPDDIGKCPADFSWVISVFKWSKMMIKMNSPPPPMAVVKMSKN